MLCGRRIATPDVAALGTAPPMKPPSIRGKALGTAIAAGTHARVDQWARATYLAAPRLFGSSVVNCWLGVGVEQIF